MINKTYNFKAERGNYVCPAALKGEFKDYRNGITCIDPTGDIQCYLNYIEFLNLNRDNWKSVGYLDLGMMPLVMGPSFLHATLIDGLVNVMGVYGIPCYSMKPVSVMYADCKMAEDDIWLKKSEVARVTAIPEDKLTLERLIRWCTVK